jgi:hypothetical protein
MRLNEFTDPRHYLSTRADAARLLEQIETFWPTRIEDDDSPSLNRSKKRPSDDRMKRLDAR